MKRPRRYLAAVIALAFSVVLPAPAQAAADPVSVVAAGLDSPRGLDLMGGAAVIAEAGHGSNTSQVSTVNLGNGAHTTLAGNLFSVLIPEEGVVLGASGVTVHEGRIYVIFGASPQETGNAQAGALGVVHPRTHTVSTIANVGQWDRNWTASLNNPNQEVDANPNAVMVTEDGFLVADSGANTITQVSRDGSELSVAQYFPMLYSGPPNFGFPHDEVPTCIAASEDALWVGTLAGNLFRLGEDGATRMTVKDGSGHDLLHHVTGCTSSGGRLYLVNMFGPGIPFAPPPASLFFRGSVVQYDIESGQARELADSFTSPALSFPYTPAVRDGNLYVTAGAICTASGGGPPGCHGGGRLVKIKLSGNGEGGD